MIRIPLVLSALALVLALTPRPGASQEAEPAPHRVGIGFHSSDTPIGGRWWMSNNQYALDLGFGLGTEKGVTLIDTNNNGANDTRVEQTLAHWTVELGMPWAITRWSKVAVMLRPGFRYTSEDDLESFLADGERVKRNTYGVTAELGVEWQIARNLGISASHGLAYSTTKLDQEGAVSQWALDTTASDFTSLGFYVYLWK
jgi:hypothetical protein